MNEVRKLTYRGDSRSMIGSFIKTPLLRRDGRFTMVEWLASGAEYDAGTNKTTVSFVRQK